MPFPLPHFTFLCGPPSQGKVALAKALADQDPDLCIGHLQWPLQEAARTLFWFESNFVDINLLPNSATTYLEWNAIVEEHLRKVLGPSALGQLFVNIGTTTAFQFWNKVLIGDLYNLNDALPFVPLFKGERGLFIFLGPIPLRAATSADFDRIWLSVPETHKQLEQLARELSILQGTRSCQTPSSELSSASASSALQSSESSSSPPPPSESAP